MYMQQCKLQGTVIPLKVPAQQELSVSCLPLCSSSLQQIGVVHGRDALTCSDYTSHALPQWHSHLRIYTRVFLCLTQLQKCIGNRPRTVIYVQCICHPLGASNLRRHRHQVRNILSKTSLLYLWQGAGTCLCHRPLDAVFSSYSTVPCTKYALLISRCCTYFLNLSHPC
jgi:hypothetical protein